MNIKVGVILPKMFGYLRIAESNDFMDEMFFRKSLVGLGVATNNIIVEGDCWLDRESIEENVVMAYNKIADECPAAIFIVGDDACNKLISQGLLRDNIFHYAFAYGGRLPIGKKFFRANYSMEQIAKLWRQLFQIEPELRNTKDCKGIIFRSELNCNEVQAGLIRDYIGKRYNHLQFYDDIIYHDNDTEEWILHTLSAAISLKPSVIWVVGVGKEIDKRILECIAKLQYTGFVFSTEMHNHFLAQLQHIPAKGIYFITPAIEKEIIESVYCRGCFGLFSDILNDSVRKRAASLRNSALAIDKIPIMLDEEFRRQKYFIKSDSIGRFSYDDFGELSSELHIKHTDRNGDTVQKFPLSKEDLEHDIFTISSYLQDVNLLVKSFRYDIAHRKNWGDTVKKILRRIRSEFCNGSGRVVGLIHYANQQDVIIADVDGNNTYQLGGVFNLLKLYISQVQSINDALRASSSTENVLSPFPIQINNNIDEFNDNEVFQVVLRIEQEWMLPCQFLAQYSCENDTKISIDAIGFKHGPLYVDVVCRKSCEDVLYKAIVSSILKPAAKSRSYQYIIPDFNSSSFANGAVFVESDKYLPYPDIQMISTTTHSICSPYIEYCHMQRLGVSNTKSAIGSIMSRNGSHNIGSHVLAALSHNVGTMPDDRVLYQYIQHRMDYIATATTDFPTWASEEKLVNGLMRRFLSQRHLLDYIASSEGLHAFKFQDPNISEDAEQPNTIRLRIRKLDEKGPPREFIKYPRVDATANFDEDVAVAIPGGVIGGHAFFTIIENVIRNAAKHGWAKISDEQKKCLKKNQEDHLDFFVDFKRSDSNRTIEIDVYDGLSDVFAIAKNAIVPKNGKELTPEEDATNKAIKNLRAEINEWKENARDSLSTRKQNENEKTEEELLADYLSGKSDTLPKLYDPIKTFLGGEEKVEGSDKPFKRCKLLSDILTGATDKDDELGHRLWLPLHHGQQLKLAKPFIDESGALRKENWGLAEMKISAGYLNRRPISEIGGLDKADPIITPVCEAGADEGAHLGYHFSIPVPREIAFVCDTTYTDENDNTKAIDPKKIAELQSHGIYIERPPKDGKYVKPKNKDDQDWNYSYIVLPKFPDQKDPHLPFRVLAKDNANCSSMVPRADFYDDTLSDLKTDKPPKQIAQELKKDVYRTWIRYWNGAPDEQGVSPLNILTQGDDDKSNMGLISNYEIWEFVFKEMFRSVVGDVLGRVTLADEVYAYILLSVAIPDDATEESSPSSKETMNEETKNKDNLRTKINDKSLSSQHFERLLILRRLQSKFERCDKTDTSSIEKALLSFAKAHKFDGSLISKWSETADGKNAPMLKVAAIKDLGKCFYRKISNSISNLEWGNDLGDIFVYQDDGVLMTNGFGVLIDNLCSAYREADIMLRKYEERIVTLPGVWSRTSLDGGEDNGSNEIENICKDLGISMRYDNRQYPSEDDNLEGRKAIAYMRHATDDSAFKPAEMHYLEPLSGTQSYLCDLQQLAKIDFARVLIAKMYETGLSNVLIIDERVSKFLRNRPDEIKTFCRMGLWCVDETRIEAGKNNVQAAFGSHDHLLELDKNIVKAFIESDDLPSDRESGKKFFDILIIHQGLIDKWLPHAGTNSAAVEKFIDKIKKRIPYVVITTGRGTPANVPDSARILPFPVLEDTIFKKYPEKLVLIDAIMHILPIGEHK